MALRKELWFPQTWEIPERSLLIHQMGKMHILPETTVALVTDGNGGGVGGGGEGTQSTTRADGLRVTW